MTYERIEGVIYHLIHIFLFHGSSQSSSASSSSNNNNDNISFILQTHLDSFQPNTPIDKSCGSKEEEEEDEEEEEIKMKRRVMREKFLFFHLKLHIQQFIQSHLISPLMTSNKLKEDQIAAEQEEANKEDREEDSDSQTTNSEDEEENSNPESDF